MLTFVLSSKEDHITLNLKASFIDYTFTFNKMKSDNPL